MKFPSLALVSLIALTAAGGASFAQPAPGAGSAASPDAGGRHWTRTDPAQMAERHAEKLRAVLQLRPDQEPALRALMDAMRPDPAQMERRKAERQEAQRLTTPQRLDRMQARMAEHQQRFQAHVEAVKRFYAQLSPAQQKAFDAMPMMGMHEHGMHGGMGHMDGRHGMHGGPDGHPHGPPPPPAGH